MSRFCATCGTEVDDTAVFCPTCGQPIDQEAEVSLPPAPTWPEPPRAEQPPPLEVPAGQPDPYAAPSRSGWEAGSVDAGAMPPPAPPRPDNFDDSTAPAPSGLTQEPTRSSARVDAPAPPPAPGPTTPDGRPADPRRALPSVDLPLTMPVTLSAWLIGGGSALGALGALISLFDGIGAAVDLLALVALAAVALSVFFSSTIPTIPHLRFVTLAILLVAFGIGIDRLGFGAAGAGELLLFLGTAAAAIGAILLELGRDQPLGTPKR